MLALAFCRANIEKNVITPPPGGWYDHDFQAISG
jgi:hypothetical protein